MKVKEYWNLIGQEPFLAITWEPDFSQACSFCRMLMSHKNFHFTQIPDKTNNVIFLKSPKTLSWGIFDHFWSFLTDDKFQKKLSQFRVNLRTDGRTDGRMDGRPYFIWPFRPRPGVQQVTKIKARQNIDKKKKTK